MSASPDMVVGTVSEEMETAAPAQPMGSSAVQDGEQAGGEFELTPALRWLDELLAGAFAAASEAYGPHATGDAFRGLHISPADAARLLAREPGAPTLASGPSADALARLPIIPRLAWLAQAFGLASFDLALALIALAPEIDLRYERLYAYLQDDVSRRMPGVDLALNLLCPSAADRLARRSHLCPTAPLLRHDLLRLVPPPDGAQAPLLAYGLRLDPQIVDVLLGQSSLDARLAAFCTLLAPAEVALDRMPLSPGVRERLSALAAGASTAAAVRVYFQGSAGAGQRLAAEALAGQVGKLLLIADLAQASLAGPEVRCLFREAWLQGAVLYLDGLDALRERSVPGTFETLLTELAAAPGITILSGERAWLPSGDIATGVVTVAFGVPPAAERRAWWAACLAGEGVAIEPADLEALAGRFRLTPGQIGDAAAAARIYGEAPGLEHLFAVARSQSGHHLAELARKIEPVDTWEDLVLPPDSTAQLREICDRVAARERVMDTWGFEGKLSQGKGITALFTGPSGTGKTMAAGIVARELGLDLYKIDLASVVSKYIGETEKNLDRVFAAGENAAAVLFFDEAEALFGKRSEVQDAHDRYANIEIAYLLQKMEAHDGVTILATNMRQNLDEAFVRRLAFMIAFPFPDEDHRRRIWEGIWPSALPVGDDVAPDLLAHRFQLTGGNIKNIALAAAFLAAADGGEVNMAHLRHATRREYQKLGQALSDAELGEAEGRQEA